MAKKKRTTVTVICRGRKDEACEAEFTIKEDDRLTANRQQFDLYLAQLEFDAKRLLSADFTKWARTSKQRPSIVDAIKGNAQRVMDDLKRIRLCRWEPESLAGILLGSWLGEHVQRMRQEPYTSYGRQQVRQLEETQKKQREKGWRRQKYEVIRETVLDIWRNPLVKNITQARKAAAERLKLRYATVVEHTKDLQKPS